MNLGIILTGITTILNAAPQIAEVYSKAKELVTVLFTAKRLTKEQQDAIHAHIDSIKMLVDAGIVPPAWQVEPDPDEP